MPNPKKKITLLLDYDGTLTQTDTLHLVAAIGYTLNPTSNLTPWNSIVQSYISDYTQHKESYTPPTSQRKTARQESEWLASLKPVERRSIARLRAAGVFSGVERGDVESAARSAVRDGKLEMRRGWRELLMLQRKDVTATVVSVNWSRAFIQASMEAAFEGSEAGDGLVEGMSVYANELPLTQDVPDPDPASYICTSEDKLATLNTLRGGREDGDFVIYVGDSATDFDCLIAADVGVCVRDDALGGSQRELKDTLERVGFEILRLNFGAFEKSRCHGLERSNAEGEGKRIILWWVEGLDEVARFIEELHERV